MERRPEDVAVEPFRQGFTCGQAVLAAFAGRGDLTREAALRVACAFGGGIARSGGTCGAASGAPTAIGLELGRTTGGDGAAREGTHEAGRASLERFRRAHGSEVCREPLGVDLGTPEGREAAVTASPFTSRCAELVRSTARIVQGLFEAGRGT